MLMGEIGRLTSGMPPAGWSVQRTGSGMDRFFAPFAYFVVDIPDGYPRAHPTKCDRMINIRPRLCYDPEGE
jgi:hypothetical protein